MMALSSEDREWVKLISEKLAYAALQATLKDHVKACPHGRRITLVKGVLMGMAAALMLMGAGGVGNWLVALAGGGL